MFILQSIREKKAPIYQSTLIHSPDHKLKLKNGKQNSSYLIKKRKLTFLRFLNEQYDQFHFSYFNDNVIIVKSVMIMSDNDSIKPK